MFMLAKKILEGPNSPKWVTTIWDSLALQNNPKEYSTVQMNENTWKKHSRNTKFQKHKCLGGE